MTKLNLAPYIVRTRSAKNGNAIKSKHSYELTKLRRDLNSEGLYVFRKDKTWDLELVVN